MYTLWELLRMLVENTVRLTDIFVSEVILGVDPVTAALWVVGQIVIWGTVLVMGYLALGGLLDAIGVQLPRIGRRGPAER